MSSQLIFKQWSVLATATSLADILADSRVQFLANLVVRNRSNSAGSLFWGDSNVTNIPTNAGGEIKPGESVSFDLINRYMSVNRLYFVGTGGDVAFFTSVS